MGRRALSTSISISLMNRGREIRTGSNCRCGSGALSMAFEGGLEKGAAFCPLWAGYRTGDHMASCESGGQLRPARGSLPKYVQQGHDIVEAKKVGEGLVGE